MRSDCRKHIFACLLPLRSARGRMLLCMASFFLFFAIEAGAAQQGYRFEKAKKSPPPFTQVEAVVKSHFEKIPGFTAKGVITVSQTAPLFAKLQRIGWNIPPQERREILDRILPDGSFLAKQLSTPAGRRFAAEIYKYPDGFDRLDRLSRMPQGKDTVKRLIRGPGGYKLIQYMTTSAGGKNMGRMLSNTPKGGNFNKPTRRIYTLKMLLAELQKLYKDTFDTGKAKRPEVVRKSAAAKKFIMPNPKTSL